MNVLENVFVVKFGYFEYLVSKASFKKVKVLVHPSSHKVTLFAAIYIPSQLNEIYIAFILLVGGWVFNFNVLKHWVTETD
jgi:hypothetical protein